MDVTVTKKLQTIPTYPPKKASDLPVFFENRPYQGASGRVYPIPYASGITDCRENAEYEVFTLENEYIKTQVLPELGGKILRGYDKIGQYDFIYYNEVIKPALVGLAGPWISGGIEFNWPQHHRPTTFMPLEAAVEDDPRGGRTVWTGEVEPLGRMKGMVGVTVEPGRSYIRAKVRVYNRTALPQVFMWWANLAAPANDRYRAIFPPDVEWVNDHDRRAVLSWPVAKGVYRTARPFDYGEGTDISRYSAVRVPSSFLVSQGQSDMDFVAGYDEGRQKGILTVADHHVAPGKKLWHWGIGEFGDMWCSNLTDQNGPYIELMTGVYTDNQPDFTWLAPYETREFEQVWYPIRDLGGVKNATVDAAVNVEKREKDLFIGFNVTGSFEKTRILVRTKDTELYSESADLDPTSAYLRTVPLGDSDFNDITVSLRSAEGRVLVEYTPYIRGQKMPIEVRKPVRHPGEIDTVEELYINGLHLEQYKQHNYKPEEYYREGLRRDGGDIRCNTAMGRLSLRNGDFDKCVEYCDTAVRRLTSRNQHPTDTEAFYLKGIALKYLGRLTEAYEALFQAGWNYTHRCAAYYELAAIDCAQGRYADALDKLEVSLGLNIGHQKAANLKAAILRAQGKMEEAKRQASANALSDRLDLWAKIELSHFSDIREELRQFLKKPENILDVVCDYLSAGLYGDALNTLDRVEGDYPLYHYYRAYCLGKLGGDELQEIRAAEAMDTGYCFPARLEDIGVLQNAITLNPTGANAPYYLGCLLYDKLRCEEAVTCWEMSIKNNSTHAKSWRNLAIAYFDKRGEADRARVCMEKALECKSGDSRLLMEYQQLLKNSNTPIDERLGVYEKYSGLLAERDDCILDQIVLTCLKGDYPAGIKLAANRRFHIYEGGEGKLTKLHAWMHVLYALELAKKGDTAKAEEALHDAVNMPKSYGEAKTYFNQEAHIYYYLGLLLEGEERRDEACRAFEEASTYKAAVSELSLFRALALNKLGRYAEAKAVLDEMSEAAEKTLKNKDIRPYYGVGSPSPMPFENDIEKLNLCSGSILKAYALLGYGKKAEAEEAMAEARKLDPFDFRIYTYDIVKASK